MWIIPLLVLASIRRQTAIMPDYTPTRYRQGRRDDYMEPLDDGYYYSRDHNPSRARSLGYDVDDRRGTAVALRPKDHHSDRGRAHSLDRRHRQSARSHHNHTNHHNQHHHRGRRDSPQPALEVKDSKREDESRSNRKLQHAAKAAMDAAAVESFRLREAPGDWIGPRGVRVATAALGAAVVDGLRDRDPDKHHKRTLVESAIGGLLANRLVNGSRKDLKYR